MGSRSSAQNWLKLPDNLDVNEPTGRGQLVRLRDMLHTHLREYGEKLEAAAGDKRVFAGW